MKKIRNDTEAVAFVQTQMERRGGSFNCKDLREMVREERFTRAQFHIAIRVLDLKGHNRKNPMERAFNTWHFSKQTTKE